MRARPARCRRRGGRRSRLQTVTASGKVRGVDSESGPAVRCEERTPAFPLGVRGSRFGLSLGRGRGGSSLPAGVESIAHPRIGFGDDDSDAALADGQMREPLGQQVINMPDAE